MNKKTKTSLIPFLTLLISICSGCSSKNLSSSMINSSTSSNINAYGERIEENLETKNIIEDKYRNYYEIFVYSFRDSNGDGYGD